MSKARQRKLDARSKRIESKAIRYTGQGPVPKQIESKAVPVIKESRQQTPSAKAGGRGRPVKTGNLKENMK